MAYENRYIYSRKLCRLQHDTSPRILDPSIINVAFGYKIEVYAEGLDTPIGMAFNENGDMLIADAGLATGNPKVILLSNGNFETIEEGFNLPVTGINCYNGSIYVTHRRVVSIIEDGVRKDIISGLPGCGDFCNNRVEFGRDRKMYFGMGTATNSGVVGLDNDWIYGHSFCQDYVGYPVIIRGINYRTPNILIPAEEFAYTGAFSPFRIPNKNKLKMEDGKTLSNGSILRGNPDGTNLELLAWGLRNPFQVRFDINDRLIIANQGMEARGSRPIANGADELYVLREGAWYGWPDYVAGEPVSLPKFKPVDAPQPQLLLETIPSIPPYPLAKFPASSTIMGFDFNYDEAFGPVGDAYIAQFGHIMYQEDKDDIRTGVGHRIMRVNMDSGEVSTFAINNTGFPEEEGLGRPTDVKFGPDGAMYITDFAIASEEYPRVYLPNTGVIWKITKV